MFASLGSLTNNDEDHHQNEISNQHEDRAVKAPNIPSANALRKEDAMVVIVTDAHVALLTVIHLLGHAAVALLTILVHLVFARLRIKLRQFGGLIKLTGLILLEGFLSPLSHRHLDFLGIFDGRIIIFNRVRRHYLFIIITSFLFIINDDLLCCSSLSFQALIIVLDISQVYPRTYSWVPQYTPRQHQKIKN